VDGQNVLVDADGSGITQAHYTDNPGSWGGVVSQRRGGVSSFYVFDPSRNTRALMDVRGATLLPLLRAEYRNIHEEA